MAGIAEEVIEEEEKTIIQYEGLTLYIPEDSLPDAAAFIQVRPVISEELTDQAMAPIVSPLFEFVILDSERNDITDDVKFSKEYIGSIEYDENLIPED